MSEVSVVLTVMNEGESMRSLLKELTAQSRMPDEIVIVDGGSKDNTVSIIKEYQKMYPFIRLYEKPGVNIAKGRNIAITKSKYSIIAVTDGGCRPDNNWLNALISPLLESQEYAAVAGKIVPEPRTRFEYYSGLLSQPSDNGDPYKRTFFGRSSAFRKSAWKKVGGYPEWLYTAEDTLFARRFNDMRMKVAYAEDSILYWRPRKNFRSFFKMFFLYGVGNGRVGMGSLKGSFYWTKYHLLWIGGCALSPIYPGSLVVTGVTLGYLYYIMVWPNIKNIKCRYRGIQKHIYISILVFLRNIGTNTGYIIGKLEAKKDKKYCRNLKNYIKISNSNR